MATEIAPSVERVYAFPNQPVTHLLIKARPARQLFRRGVRAVAGKRKGAAVPIEVSPAFYKGAEGFRAEGWAFSDEFLAPASHQALVDGWPPRIYFEPMSDIHKSYDQAYKWVRNGQDYPSIERFPALKATYDMLRSDAFADQITAYCGDGVHRTCYSITSNWSKPGSSVIPHRDSNAHDPEGEHFINLLFFVLGTGGERGGGTAILADAEGEQTIFEPTELNNTALIYRSAAPFFHGFAPMRRGTYRWCIGAQYSDPTFG